jgi:6-phosphogluconolactonase (cycloisomerase 2 family)
MNRFTKLMLAIGFMALTSGSAMATTHICAYANDNIDGPNTVDGYYVVGSHNTYVTPVATGGSGTGLGFYAGGLVTANMRTNDLYVSDGGTDSIAHFTIDPSTCVPTFDAEYPSGDTAVFAGDALVVAKNGQTMFIGSSGDKNIYSAAINTDGSLGTPTLATPSMDDYPLGMTLTPNGKTLLVSYIDLFEVCAYPINTGNALGSPNCANVPSGVNPTAIAVDSADQYVYVGSSGGKTAVSVLQLGTGSSLTFLACYGKPCNNGSDLGDASGASGVALSPFGNALYITNQGTSSITVASVTTGVLSLKRVLIVSTTNDEPCQAQTLAYGAKNIYLVTGDYSSSMTPGMGIWQVRANGAITGGFNALVPGGTTESVYALADQP